jgi:hypothetical protein
MADRNPDYPNLMAPWKPGQSGNPKGCPKGKTIEESIREVLAEQIELKDGETVLTQDAVAREFVRWMLCGGQQSVQAIKEFLARDWPTVSKHQVEVEHSDPVHVPATDERVNAVAKILQETLH